MLEFPLAFQAGIELLPWAIAAVPFAVAIRLEQVAPAVGEDDRDVAPAVDLDRADHALLPKMPEVAVA